MSAGGQWLDQGSVGGQSGPTPTPTQYLKITVEDRGIGVPEHMRARLFRSFSKAQSKVNGGRAVVVVIVVGSCGCYCGWQLWLLLWLWF